MGNVICITGMHRSGTSLTASWLERCGLVIHSGRVYEAAAGNPRGHFEDIDVVELHSAALQDRGYGSVGWGLDGQTFLAFGTDEHARARHLVEARHGRFPVWGWKDPRSVLFLEHWKALIPELTVLLLWRPAVEVVDSLLRRSRRTANPDMQARLWPSIALWSAHNRLVLQYRRKHMESTVLLPLERLLARDRAAFDLIERRCGLGLDYAPLGELYRPELLNQRGSKAHRALRAATGLRGCRRLEAELLAVSDSP